MFERLLTGAALLAFALPTARSQQPTASTPNAPKATPLPSKPPEAGAVGGRGLALKTAKALTAKWVGERVIDNAVVLVKDGRIEAIGKADEIAIPAGYEVIDVGDKWLMPGLIDLHSHVGGSFDINDMVYVTQPELKVHASIVPHNQNFKRALAGGVTTVLYIPGSGVNSGGQGVLLKTGLDNYEEAVVRDPGSLKVAQWGNPERWGIGVGKTWENWHLRDMFQRGMAYAKQWAEYEKDPKGPEPEKKIEYEVFRDLLAKRTQVSTHTQVYQVVLETLEMIRKEFGIDVYIDHGEWKGYLTAEMAQELGVNAIIGPREIDWRIASFSIDTDGQIQGIAGEYQKRGLKKIGFNTDSPVVPEEELQLQAGVASRYGFQTDDMQAVVGLTIVPAMTAGIDTRVGSLEPGKDADILVIRGDPADPRSTVESVFINGKHVYDSATERQRW